MDRVPTFLLPRHAASLASRLARARPGGTRPPGRATPKQLAVLRAVRLLSGCFGRPPEAAAVAVYLKCKPSAVVERVRLLRSRGLLEAGRRAGLWLTAAGEAAAREGGAC